MGEPLLDALLGAVASSPFALLALWRLWVADKRIQKHEEIEDAMIAVLERIEVRLAEKNAGRNGNGSGA